MARFVEETAAELKVLSMRAKRGPWEPPPAISSAVLIGEHLRHTGAVGTTEVEGDMCLIDRDVVRMTAIEPCAIDVYHLTTTGQPRGLFVRHLTTTGQSRGVFVTLQA